METESTAGSDASAPGCPAVSQDGVVFLRVRSCTACGVKNTDPNEITASTLFGPEKNPYTVWNRGSSIDPRTKHCKICDLTFVQGGFNAADSQTLTFDDFSEKLKHSTDLSHEFKGARAEMVKLLNEGVVRFRGTEKTGRIQAAAKRSLQAFKQNQVEVVSRYKAVDKDKYEKEHPGRIQRENLRTTTKMIDGERREVVLVRRDPDGEWDVNIKDISGTVQEEELDNQQTILRANQMALKQENARKRFKSLWQDQANTPAALKKEDTTKTKEEEEEKREEAELSEEEEMPMRTLLEEAEEADVGPSKAQMRQGAPSPKSRPKGGNSKGPKAVAAPAGGGGKSHAASQGGVGDEVPGQEKMPPPAFIPKLGKLPAASKSTKDTAKTADIENTGDKGSGTRGRPSKFKGKTAHEVLEKHGLSELQPVLDKTCLECTGVAFQT